MSQFQKQTARESRVSINIDVIFIEIESVYARLPESRGRVLNLSEFSAQHNRPERPTAWYERLQQQGFHPLLNTVE